MTAVLRHFALPDVGEGLTEGEILTWLVAVGDTITVNQPLCEVETAKAAVELPSPYAGTVVELLHRPGTTIDVGTPIITVDVGPDGDPGPVAPPPTEERTAVLVGYGPRGGEPRRRPRRAVVAVVEPPSEPVVGARPNRPLSKPPVRKYAKDVGVDLASVAGTGDGGVITRADVDAARSAPAQPTAPAVGARIPIKGIRKHTAAAMVASAFTAPHVTEFLTIDITRTMKLRQRLLARPELAGVKASPLAFVARALLLAVQRHPLVNSSWDDAAQEIVVHPVVNLGIAAATPRGLVVPNIKDAGRLGLAELAGELAELTTTARAGRTSPEALRGGTITITNVGVFGIDTGTPILNPGESAILAFGAVREAPWVHKGKVRVRQVTQLALSFDHRVIDGEQGSRFLADLGALLSDPGTALLG